MSAYFVKNREIVDKLYHFVQSIDNIVFSFISGSLAEGKIDPRDIDLTIVVNDWENFNKCVNRVDEFSKLNEFEKEFNKPIDLHCCTIDEIKNFINQYIQFKKLAINMQTNLTPIWCTYVILNEIYPSFGEYFLKNVVDVVPIREKYVLLKNKLTKQYVECFLNKCCRICVEDFEKIVNSCWSNCSKACVDMEDCVEEKDVPKCARNCVERTCFDECSDIIEIEPEILNCILKCILG